ncbi:hypothetical protein BN8_05853 [Fibrisoma limi BUZ 3]|uniref:Thioredoxin domain-containing protein n=1 Tax=Fibrisoma limi BUZ 3 TaxID=1185876 RepID=I2GRI0_9BACT|nr:hypothetical protein [Fibrisoma limi]CCH56508.1 hypothetical protein BN8_05853 [Fibrisoma limi BUZ 3]
MKIVTLSILFTFLLLTSQLAQAQGIVFEQTNWPEVIKKAQKQKKLIFLHFDKPGCTGCNEVASKAFNSPLIREKFSLNFISFRTDGSVGIGKELADKLEVECLPSSVFLDTDETPLARFCGSTTMDRVYLEKAEEALTTHRDSPLKPIAEAYKKGDRSATLMRTYIEYRRNAGLSHYELLDEYIRSLPNDSLRSADLLRFLFEQGPIVGSRADSVFRLNRYRRDSLYRAVGWNKAVELNNRIINGSIKKAIRDKDVKLAYQTAYFTRGTHTNNPKAGAAAFEWTMIRYYKGVKDTANYLSTAVRYYDTNFMPARVDSIQKLDELENQRRMRGMMPPVSKGQKPGTMVSFMANPNTQRFVSALNQAAWDFYEMTREPRYLEKALEWSKRTLEYREDASFMDTYAHILYRLGRKQEALEWQEKAVKREQEMSSPLLSSIQESLRKMKDGSL